MNEPGAETIQSDTDAAASGIGEAELWLKKIKRAQDDEKKWRDDAKMAVSAYEADDDKAISFNIFHSNIETMIPALYNSPPVPDVRRRFGDADPIGKQVADLTERSLSYSLDQYDIDGEMLAMLRDGLVTGRGVLRLRYTPHKAEDGQEGGYQELTCERVPWDKFIRGPARAWSRVPWCGVEHDLTKDELRKLNPALAEKSTLGERSDTHKDHDKSKDPSGVLKTTRVYEIWDKASRNVLFIDDQKQLWSKQKDVLGLPDFLPFMQPLQPVHRPTSMVPVCQYKVYKPLLDELDAVTKRISKLVRQLKVRGLVDGEMAPDFELLKNCDDGQYVAASNAAQFASQGGLEKGIAHWPLDPIVKALQQLYVQRDVIKETIYEVTGISDILRGASNPHETLGAQEIKKETASLRIQRLQGEVARVARELFRAKVAVIAKHFLDENIMLITGMPVKAAAQPQMQPPPQMQGQPPQGQGQPMPPMPQAPQMSQAEQQWPQVLQTFRSEIRSYRIDIETDSTIRADTSRNQEQMNGFLAGTGQFAQAMAEIIQIPTIGQAAMPAMVEVYTAFARKFKLGKQAEDALDKLSSTTQQMAQQPPEEKPNPEVEKAQAQIAMLKEKHQADMATAQGKMQLEGQALQAKSQLETQGLQAKIQSDERLAQLAEQKAQMELAIKSAELQMKREEMAMNMQAMQAEHEMKRENMALDAQAARETHAMDQAGREADIETMTQTHDLKRQGMADKAKFDKRKMQNGARANA